MTTYKDKRTKRWRYDVMVEGRRYTKSGFQTKASARAAGEKRREQAELGLMVDSWTFGQLVESFLIESARTKSPDWAYQLKTKLNAGFAALEKIAIADLKPLHFQAALNVLSSEGLKGSTVNEYRKIAHSVMQYAVKLEAVGRNPVSVVSRVPEDETEVEPIPLAHLQRLILAADVVLSALLLFLSQTGARWVEASRLRWTEVFVTSERPFCVLTTRKRRGGGEKKRPQPLTSFAVDAVQRVRGRSPVFVFPSGSGDQMSYQTVLRQLGKLCERLKIPAYSFHQVRHYAGTVAANMGKNPKAVSKFLGQSSTGATERYMHAIDPQIWEVAERLEREMTAIQKADDDAAGGTNG